MEGTQVWGIEQVEGRKKSKVEGQRSNGKQAETRRVRKVTDVRILPISDTLSCWLSRQVVYFQSVHGLGVQILGHICILSDQSLFVNVAAYDHRS
jgi:hypothetical protein